MQHDGDLWQLAWRAILTRGAGNHDLRKVIGHATPEDLDQGRSNVEGKEGNDVSDVQTTESTHSMGKDLPGYPCGLQRDTATIAS